jgi:hypothetical protein
MMRPNRCAVAALLLIISSAFADTPSAQECAARTASLNGGMVECALTTGGACRMTPETLFSVVLQTGDEALSAARYATWFERSKECLSRTSSDGGCSSGTDATWDCFADLASDRCALGTVGIAEAWGFQGQIERWAEALNEAFAVCYTLSNVSACNEESKLCIFDASVGAGECHVRVTGLSDAFTSAQYDNRIRAERVCDPWIDLPDPPPSAAAAAHAWGAASAAAALAAAALARG